MRYLQGISASGSCSEATADSQTQAGSHHTLQRPSGDAVQNPASLAQLPQGQDGCLTHSN